MESFEREIYAHYFEVENFQPMPNETKSVSLDFLLENYEAFFFDAFGTFYCQNECVYPGAVEMYNKVRASGKPMRLVTNAASTSIPLMVESLARMQIPFEASEILSSGDLFAPFAKEKGIHEAFYIGRPNGTHFVEKGGVQISDNPSENTVIVSATGKEEHLFEDALKILRRPGAKMVVLNPDAWAPRIHAPREGVSGCYAHRLYKEALPETFYFGKPFKALYEKALASLPRKMKTVMIGDTLATDIGGAMHAGIDAALLIGRNQPAAELEDDEKFLKLRPTYYLDKL